MLGNMLILTRRMGDWLIQLDIGLIAGVIVGISVDLWIGTYAFITGGLISLIGVKTKYPKQGRRGRRT